MNVLDVILPSKAPPPGAEDDEHAAPKVAVRRMARKRTARGA